MEQGGGPSFGVAVSTKRRLAGCSGNTVAREGPFGMSTHMRPTGASRTGGRSRTLLERRARFLAACTPVAARSRQAQGQMSQVPREVAHTGISGQGRG